MSQERDDYADLDLPPESVRSRLAITLFVIAAVIFSVVIGLPLLARLLAAKMAWN